MTRYGYIITTIFLVCCTAYLWYYYFYKNKTVKQNLREFLQRTPGLHQNKIPFFGTVSGATGAIGAYKISIRLFDENETVPLPIIITVAMNNAKGWAFSFNTSFAQAPLFTGHHKVKTGVDVIDKKYKVVADSKDNFARLFTADILTALNNSGISSLVLQKALIPPYELFAIITNADSPNAMDVAWNFMTQLVERLEQLNIK